MLNPVIAIIGSIIVLLFSTAEGIYISRHKSITEMYGMMIGMTQGMMTGIAVGYFVGATTDMFVGTWSACWSGWFSVSCSDASAALWA